MFQLDPISTTNIVSIAQILLVAAGFYFSWRSLNTAIGSLNTATNSLNLTTSNAQAQLYNQILLQGRDLQFKQMELFADPDTGQAKRQQQDAFIGMILGYYAGAFELRRVLNMPESTKKLMDAELRELMGMALFRNKWDEVRNKHSKEFNKHVDELRGVQ